MLFLGRTLFVGAAVKILVLVTSLGALGCSDGRPARVPVSGQVLIDGQPLKFGSIQFIPKGARASGGQLDSNGHFVLSCFDQGDGAVLGMHQVAVKAGQYRNDAETYWHAPKKYNDAGTSGLTEEVTEPTNSLTIKLTWDGKGPFLEMHEGTEKWRLGREPKK
jgi:hypothetical protein